MTIVDPAGIPFVEPRRIVVSPACADLPKVVGVSVWEYSPEPTSPVSSASNSPALSVRTGYVPLAWYQRRSPWSSAIPIAMPESASYGEPFPQFPPRMALIGVGLPLAAPLATLTDVGVLSLCPEISTTCPAQPWPGTVTVASSSCHGKVWLPVPLQHGSKWSFAVTNRPIGPM